MYFLYCNKSVGGYSVDMTKMGRPTISKTDRRNCSIQVRLTADEHKAINNAAKKSGKKLSEWARKALLSKLNVIQ